MGIKLYKIAFSYIFSQPNDTSIDNEKYLVTHILFLKRLYLL